MMVDGRENGEWEKVDVFVANKQSNSSFLVWIGRACLEIRLFEQKKQTNKTLGSVCLLYSV